MKSEWRVTSNYIGDTKMFAIYRLKDISEVDHSGNRELAGGYVADRTAAEITAIFLNEMEKMQGFPMMTKEDKS